MRRNVDGPLARRRVASAVVETPRPGGSSFPIRDAAQGDRRARGCCAATWAPDGCVREARRPRAALPPRPRRAVLRLGGGLLRSGWKARKIAAGDVVVIRYEGPAGGPGHGARCCTSTAALVGEGLGDEGLALITDGRFSGATHGPDGPGHIRAGRARAHGGPDRRRPRRRPDRARRSTRGSCGCSCPADENRRAARPPSSRRRPRYTKGVLARYARGVSSASEGAVLR